MIDPTRLCSGAASGRESANGRRSFLRKLLYGTLVCMVPAAALPRSLRAQCEPTTDDILGPFWVEDAPWRTVLASPDEPGTRLFISGRVLADDCATPLEGTIVDVWHSSDAGCYSAVGMDCPDEDTMNLRGQMLADAEGRYAYETILPGYYAGRCRHIHLRIVPPEGEMLVTQLYFEGDPRIPDDPYASDPDAINRIIPLEEDENGALHGEFAINLGVEAPAEVDPEDRLPTRTRLYQNYPNPFLDRTTIRFQTPAEAEVDLSIFTLDGRRVRTLRAGGHGAGYYTVDWDGRDDAGRMLASGAFLCRLVSGPRAFTRKLLLAH